MVEPTHSNGSRHRSGSPTAAALSEARNQGLRRVVAMVEVDNRAGIDFFLDQGFEETNVYLPGFLQLARVVHGAGRQPPLEISV